MGKQDRTLLVILGIILGLVILALALFFLRQGEQDYGNEDTSSGVVRNYILALERGDIDRAYAYLSESKNRPDVIRFRSDLLSIQGELGNTSVQIGEEDVDGEKSLVILYINHHANGPFQNVWRETGSAILVKDASGAWKIAKMPYPYWSYVWDESIKIPNP